MYFYGGFNWQTQEHQQQEAVTAAANNEKQLNWTRGMMGMLHSPNKSGVRREWEHNTKSVLIISKNKPATNTQSTTATLVIVPPLKDMLRLTWDGGEKSVIRVQFVS